LKCVALLAIEADGCRTEAEVEEIAGIMTAKNSDRWTQEDDEHLRRLLVNDTPPSEIAETLGRTVSAVKARAYLLGITLARFGIRRRGMSMWG
jgi:hypothetical protein